MAVEAVGYVVIQKLTDMVNEEEIMGQRVIVDQLKKIKEAVEQMKGYFIDAETKQKDYPEIKSWADDYLKNVYYVEDAIEIFAFRIDRQRKRLGFLMNHALFLKNFTVCKKLKRKMKKIEKKIKLLNDRMPDGVENASLSASINSVLSLNIKDHDNVITGEEEEEKEVVDSKGGKEERKDIEDKVHEDPENFGRIRKGDVMQKQNTLVHTGRSTSHGTGKQSMNDVALIRERLLYTKLTSSFAYEEDELGIVGFKEDLHNLADELLENGSEAHQIISIFGEMGSGKTTLTQGVVATKKIKNHFKPCVRVNISKESTTEEILLKLLKQVGSSEDQSGEVTEQSLKSRLSAHLKDKRYLIVLEDVWTSGTWESLGGAFPKSGNGSKIIITSCHDEVAKCAIMKFCLKGLNDEESWELFLRKAAVEKVPDGLKQVILKICGGLPLNIVLLGSLLSTKKENEYGQLANIPSDLQRKWCTSDILALSYNDLPSDLQLCMLYMVLFPKDYEIPVRRLLRLWLAEGFIRRPDQKDFPEDVAQQYFDDLFQRSLIQISKQRSDGNHRKSCCLLGVLHDFLSSKASDINLFHAPKEPLAGQPATSSGARRLVEYVNSTNSSHDLPRLERIRSYLSFNFQKKDIPAIEVGNLLKEMTKKSFRLLRVLDLEGVYRPSLPDNLGDFFHLRYLGLRWTFLDFLPSSVCELTYLETLDIKRTYVNSLPTSIWKLKRLRHLNLNEMQLDMPRVSPGPLPRLLTLWGLSIIDSDSLLKNGLNRLLYLRELGITFHLSNSKALLGWVSELTTLQQLMLQSKDDTGRPSKLHLSSLSKLDQLSNMDLLGHLDKLPDISGFPRNIKVLSLSVSLLKEDPMPTLGQLRWLTVLRLLANSYLGKEIVCPQGGFQELRVLKLWMLKNLEKWCLERGAMGNLEELNIRCCYRLKSIPEALRFRELTLTNMPPEFIEGARKGKSRSFTLIEKNYSFKALPWEEGDDSFDGMVGIEKNANGC